ncbi:MAG: glucose-6-phosphate isomerase, partial [Coleofasciculaceae cyanobacterium]
HQPGVEAGKKAATAVLDLQKQVMQALQDESTAITLSDLATKAGAVGEIEAVYKLLRHLHSNHRGVVLQGNLAQPDSLMVSSALN